MCVYIYIYIYIHTHTHKSVYVGLDIFVHKRVCTFTQTCILHVMSIYTWEREDTGVCACVTRKETTLMLPCKEILVTFIHIKTLKFVSK